MPSPLTILVATMTGTAEMVAQEVQQVLEAAGHEVELRMMDGLDAGIFSTGGRFLVCTSTYGFGNVPDNAQELIDSLESTRPDLSAVVYGVIALGDRTYGDTFCHGGARFDALLSSLGARRSGEVLQHDASSGDLPEEVAPAWALAWARAIDEHGAGPAGQRDAEGPQQHTQSDRARSE
ncbi:MAG: flavodoxin domain-containing protein [Burkholderiaceae bacterium]|nr:flavodoxin domain-containing protein [Burkholderiaceae bacterium]